MKIIYNNMIPSKGFRVLNLFGVLFARNKFKPLNNVTINHEAIHTAQMKEWLYIWFYILYFAEYLLKGYYGISFEKEAYKYGQDLNYLSRRKHYANFRNIQ